MVISSVTMQGIKVETGDISLSSLGELNDVDLTTTPPQDGQTLIWNGT